MSLKNQMPNAHRTTQERPFVNPRFWRVPKISKSTLPIPSRVVSWEKPNQIPYAHFERSA